MAPSGTAGSDPLRGGGRPHIPRRIPVLMRKRGIPIRPGRRIPPVSLANYSLFVWCFGFRPEYPQKGFLLYCSIYLITLNKYLFQLFPIFLFSQRFRRGFLHDTARGTRRLPGMGSAVRGLHAAVPGAPPMDRRPLLHRSALRPFLRRRRLPSVPHRSAVVRLGLKCGPLGSSQ